MKLIFIFRSTLLKTFCMVSELICLYLSLSRSSRIQNWFLHIFYRGGRFMWFECGLGLRSLFLHGRDFSRAFVYDSLLDGNPLTDSFQRVSTLVFLKLSWSILVQKLVDWEVAASNLDLNGATLDFDHYSTWTKLIDSFGLAHEHHLQLLTIRIVVDVLWKFHIYRVCLKRDVDSNARLEIKDVLLQCIDFILKVSDQRKQV